jgi:hypothetical protein
MNARIEPLFVIVAAWTAVIGAAQRVVNVTVTNAAVVAAAL